MVQFIKVHGEFESSDAQSWQARCEGFIFLRKVVKFMKCKLSKHTYNNGKRTVSGTAAVLHFFKEHGGVDRVMEQVAKESAQYAIQQLLAPVKK